MGCRRADHRRHRGHDSNPVRVRNRRTIATTHFAGVALALLAILLVSRPPPAQKVDNRFNAPRFSTGLRLALLSGISVGIFFLSLARTSVAAGMWPLIAARISSITLFVLNRIHCEAHFNDESDRGRDGDTWRRAR